MRNHPGELWPMMYCAGLTPLTHPQFVTRYCLTVREEVERGMWRDKVVGTKPTMVPELRQALSSILLRRTKAEVMPEMPPITVSEVVVEPCEVDEEVYFHSMWRARQNVAEMVKAQLEGLASKAETDDALARLLTDMRAKMNDTRRYIGLQKVQGTIELARTMLEGGVQKLVIFAWHKDVMHQIAGALKEEYGAVQVYGETPPEKRDKFVQWFQNPTARCRVIVGQVLAAGVGYTLTAANHVLMVEPSWVPADNMQALMRVHRIGQTKPVTAQFVMLRGNAVEQRVMQTLRRKTEDFLAVFS
jgi:SNF2 family DNA or RNA helicase